MKTLFKKIFSDPIFTRLLKNSGILLSGNVIASLFLLVSFVITARALGPAEFGILSIIQTYTRIIDRLVNFQSWQALIKFGSDALEKDEHETFLALIMSGFLMDLSTAVFGFLLAIGLSNTLTHFLNWAPSVTHLTQIYCVIILFNLTGAPTAILRLLNKFHVFSGVDISTAIIKSILLLFAAWKNCSMLTFLMIWLATDVCSYLCLFIFSLVELKKSGYLLNINSKSLINTHKRFPSFFKFVISSNIASTVRMAPREFDLIIVGGMLGNYYSGLYKVAKQFSNIVLRLADPLFYSIYPEMTKAHAKNSLNEFKKLLRLSTTSLGILAIFWLLGFVVGGKAIIKLTVGTEYVPVFPTMITYMVAILIGVLVTAWSPAMLALGKYNNYFLAISIATLMYFGVLPFLVKGYHLIGAALAYVFFYFVYAIIMYPLLKRELAHAANNPNT